MLLMVTGLIDNTTRCLLIQPSTSYVWSLGASKWVPSASDAVLVPVQCQQAGCGSIGTLNVPGLTITGPNDARLLYLNSVSAIIGTPQQILPVATQTTPVVVVTGQVVNLGGA